MKLRLLFITFFLCFNIFSFSLEQEVISWNKNTFVLYKINNHSFYLVKESFDRPLSNIRGYFDRNNRRDCARLENAVNKLLEKQKNYTRCLNEYSENCDKFIKDLYELNQNGIIKTDEPWPFNHQQPWSEAYWNYSWDFDGDFREPILNDDEIAQLKIDVILRSKLINELTERPKLKDIHYEKQPNRGLLNQTKSYFSEISTEPSHSQPISYYLNVFEARLIEMYPLFINNRNFSDPQFGTKLGPNGFGIPFYTMRLNAVDINCDIFNHKLDYNYATIIETTVNSILPDEADFSYVNNLQKYILKKYDDFNKFYQNGLSSNEKEKILAAYTAATIGVYTKDLSKSKKEDLLAPVYRHLFDNFGVPKPYNFSQKLYERINEHTFKHLVYFRYMYLGNDE